MIKFIKLVSFLFLINFILITSIRAQNAQPYIGVISAGTGVVTLGGILDIIVTVGNTGATTIPFAKLRPIVTVPASVTFLPDAQQTGLPVGWTILSNIGSQLRICNTSATVLGSQNITIILKVQGVLVAPFTALTAQIFFGNGTTCAPGTSVAGNNVADDFATSSVQVVAGCNLAVSASASSIICNGGSATITALTTNASGAVEYSITGGEPFQSSNIFTVNAAGSPYTVTAREVANPATCVASTIVTVIQPLAVPAPVVSIVQPTCTAALGIITLTSNTVALTFSVDGGAFANYPSGGFLLPSGSHTIIARNANNCTSVATNFLVNAQPQTPTAPVVGTITQANCTVSTGSAVLTNLPTSTWVINPGNINGSTTTTTINNLAAGTYNFTVTNSVGCTSLAASSVTINAVVGAPSTPLVSLIQPTCTVSTGSIFITSSTANLTFSLDGGAFSSYPVSGYLGIASGSHTIISQNVSGCLSPFANIIINPQPASPPVPTVAVIQPTCTVATGTVSITSTTTGFTFSFDGASFTNYPIGGYVTNAGNHTLAVQNLSGCAPNVNNNIVVNAQPATPTITTQATTIGCFGGASTLTATALGGILPYEYSLNNGIFQASNIFSVVAGTYSVQVKDLNGCIGNNTNILVIQPVAISATALATPIACNGGNSNLTIFATGGIGSYEYSVNNGPFQAANIFNLPAGTYTARVRLLNNPSCSSSTISTIIITQPAVLKATASANAINSCGGNTVVQVRATGGKAPFIGVGNFTRGPGRWSFNVIDSNGCNSVTELTILPPGCVELRAFPNPANNIISINHSAAISTGASLQVYSSNGARVYTQFVPSNSFVSKIDVSSLASGTYLLVYLNGDERKETKFLKLNK